MIGRNVLLFENGKKGKITPPYSTVPILNRAGLCLRADLDNKESFTKFIQFLPQYRMRLKVMFLLALPKLLLNKLFGTALILRQPWPETLSAK